MHHAGIQYGQGSMPSNSVQYNNVPELSVPSSTPSTTATLRQWRKKESTVVGPVEKPPLGQDQAAAAAAAPAPESHGPIARVAPQAHYPRPTEPYRYPHQYPPAADYGLNCKDLSPTPVKYSEIVEPAHPSRLDHHLSPIIQKTKEKDYLDMCSVQHTQMNNMKHPYQNMHPAMIPPPHPPQYKESHMHHPTATAFTPYPISNYKMNQYQRQYGNEGSFHLPLFNEQQFYPMDQRAYQNHHHQRMYRPQVAPPGSYRSSVQGYGNAMQGYNYKSNLQNHHDPYNRMIPHTVQKYPDYKHLEGARRVYPENLSSYPAPRVSPNYPQCNQIEYAQHYQNRRHQEYLQQHELKIPYVQGHMPDIVTENTPKSSLKQYLETWNDDIPDIQDGKAESSRSKESSLYILDSTEIPTENVQQFLHLQVDKLPENIKFLSADADSVIKPQPEDPAENLKFFNKHQTESGSSKDPATYISAARKDSTVETALNLTEGIVYQPEGLVESTKYNPNLKLTSLNLSDGLDNPNLHNNTSEQSALNLTQDFSTVIRNTSPKISVISETKKFLENETQKPENPEKNNTVIVYNEKKELHMPHLDKPVDHLGVIDELVKSSADVAFLPSDTELPDIPYVGEGVIFDEEGTKIEETEESESEPIVGEKEIATKTHSPKTEDVHHENNSVKIEEEDGKRKHVQDSFEERKGINVEERESFKHKHAKDSVLHKKETRIEECNEIDVEERDTFKLKHGKRSTFRKEEDNEVQKTANADIPRKEETRTEERKDVDEDKPSHGINVLCKEEEIKDCINDGTSPILHNTEKRNQLKLEDLHEKERRIDERKNETNAVEQDNFHQKEELRLKNHTDFTNEDATDNILSNKVINDEEEKDTKDYILHKEKRKDYISESRTGHFLPNVETQKTFQNKHHKEEMCVEEHKDEIGHILHDKAINIDECKHEKIPILHSINEEEDTEKQQSLKFKDEQSSTHHKEKNKFEALEGAANTKFDNMKTNIPPKQEMPMIIRDRSQKQADRILQMEENNQDVTEGVSEKKNLANNKEEIESVPQIKLLNEECKNPILHNNKEFDGRVEVGNQEATDFVRKNKTTAKSQTFKINEEKHRVLHNQSMNTDVSVAVNNQETTDRVLHNQSMNNDGSITVNNHETTDCVRMKSVECGTSLNCNYEEVKNEEITRNQCETDHILHEKKIKIEGKEETCKQEFVLNKNNDVVLHEENKETCEKTLKTEESLLLKNKDIKDCLVRGEEEKEETCKKRKIAKNNEILNIENKNDLYKEESQISKISRDHVSNDENFHKERESENNLSREEENNEKLPNEEYKEKFNTKEATNERIYVDENIKNTNSFPEEENKSATIDKKEKYQNKIFSKRVFRSKSVDVNLLRKDEIEEETKNPNFHPICNEEEHALKNITTCVELMRNIESRNIGTGAVQIEKIEETGIDVNSAKIEERPENISREERIKEHTTESFLPLVIEGSHILLQIGGEILEINVAAMSGRKKISVIPRSNCTVCTKDVDEEQQLNEENASCSANIKIEDQSRTENIYKMETRKDSLVEIEERRIKHCSPCKIEEIKESLIKNTSSNSGKKERRIEERRRNSILEESGPIGKEILIKNTSSNSGKKERRIEERRRSSILEESFTNEYTEDRRKEEEESRFENVNNEERRIKNLFTKDNEDNFENRTISDDSNTENKELEEVNLNQKEESTIKCNRREITSVIIEETQSIGQNEESGINPNKETTQENEEISIAKYHNEEIFNYLNEPMNCTITHMNEEETRCLITRNEETGVIIEERKSQNENQQSFSNQQSEESGQKLLQSNSNKSIDENNCARCRDANEENHIGCDECNGEKSEDSEDDGKIFSLKQHSYVSKQNEEISRKDYPKYEENCEENNLNLKMSLKPKGRNRSSSEENEEINAGVDFRINKFQIPSNSTQENEDTLEVVDERNCNLEDRVTNIQTEEVRVNQSNINNQDVASTMSISSNSQETNRIEDINNEETCRNPNEVNREQILKDTITASSNYQRRNHLACLQKEEMHILGNEEDNSFRINFESLYSKRRNRVLIAESKEIADRYDEENNKRNFENEEMEVAPHPSTGDERLSFRNEESNVLIRNLNLNEENEMNKCSNTFGVNEERLRRNEEILSRNEESDSRHEDVNYFIFEGERHENYERRTISFEESKETRKKVRFSEGCVGSKKRSKRRLKKEGRKNALSNKIPQTNQIIEEIVKIREENDEMDYVSACTNKELIQKVEKLPEEENNCLKINEKNKRINEVTVITKNKINEESINQEIRIEDGDSYLVAKPNKESGAFVNSEKEEMHSLRKYRKDRIEEKHRNEEHLFEYDEETLTKVKNQNEEMQCSKPCSHNNEESEDSLIFMSGNRINDTKASDQEITENEERHNVRKSNIEKNSSVEENQGRALKKLYVSSTPEDIEETLKLKITNKNINDTHAEPTKTNGEEEKVKRKSKKLQEIEENPSDEDIEIIHTEENKIRFLRRSNSKKRSKSDEEITTIKCSKINEATYKRRKSNLHDFSGNNTCYSIETTNDGSCFEEMEESRMEKKKRAKDDRKVSPLKIRIKRTRHNEEREEADHLKSEDHVESIWKIAEENLKNVEENNPEVIKNHEEDCKLLLLKNYKEKYNFQLLKSVEESNRKLGKNCEEGCGSRKQKYAGKSTVSHNSSSKRNEEAIHSDESSNDDENQKFEEIYNRNYFKTIEENNQNFEETPQVWKSIEKNDHSKIEECRRYSEKTLEGERNHLPRCADVKSSNIKSYIEEEQEESKRINEERVKKCVNEDIEKSWEDSRRDSEEITKKVRFQEENHEIEESPIQSVKKIRVEESVIKLRSSETIHFSEKTNFEESVETSNRFNKISSEESESKRIYKSKANEHTENIRIKENLIEESETSAKIVEDKPKHFEKNQLATLQDVIEDEDNQTIQFSTRREIIIEDNQIEVIVPSNPPRIEEKLKMSSSRKLSDKRNLKIEEIVQKIEERRNEETVGKLKNRSTSFKTKITEKKCNSSSREESAISSLIKDTRNTSNEDIFGNIGASKPNMISKDNKYVKTDDEERGSNQLRRIEELENHCIDRRDEENRRSKIEDDEDKRKTTQYTQNEDEEQQHKTTTNQLFGIIEGNNKCNIMTDGSRVDEEINVYVSTMYGRTEVIVGLKKPKNLQSSNTRDFHSIEDILKKETDVEKSVICNNVSSMKRNEERGLESKNEENSTFPFLEKRKSAEETETVKCLIEECKSASVLKDDNIEETCSRYPTKEATPTLAECLIEDKMVEERITNLIENIVRVHQNKIEERQEDENEIASVSYPSSDEEIEERLAHNEETGMVHRLNEDEKIAKNFSRSTTEETKKVSWNEDKLIEENQVVSEMKKYEENLRKSTSENDENQEENKYPNNSRGEERVAKFLKNEENEKFSASKITLEENRTEDGSKVDSNKIEESEDSDDHLKAFDVEEEFNSEENNISHLENEERNFEDNDNLLKEEENLKEQIEENRREDEFVSKEIEETADLNLHRNKASYFGRNKENHEKEDTTLTRNEESRTENQGNHEIHDGNRTNEEIPASRVEYLGEESSTTSIRNEEPDETIDYIEVDTETHLRANEEIEKATTSSVEEIEETLSRTSDEEIDCHLLKNKETKELKHNGETIEDQINTEIEQIVISSDEEIYTTLLTDKNITDTNEEIEETIISPTNNEEIEATILSSEEELSSGGVEEIEDVINSGVEIYGLLLTNEDDEGKEERSIDGEDTLLSDTVVDEIIINYDEEIEETIPNSNREEEVLINSDEETDFHEQTKRPLELPFEENARTFPAEFEETYPKEETLIGCLLSAEEIVIDNLDHAMINEIEICERSEESKEEIPLANEESSLSSSIEEMTFVIGYDNFEEMEIFQKKLIVQLTREDELEMAAYMKKQAEAQKKKTSRLQSYKEYMKKKGKRKLKKPRIRFKNLSSDEEGSIELLKKTKKITKKEIRIEEPTKKKLVRAKKARNDGKKKSFSTEKAETIEEIADAVNEETYRRMNEQTIEDRRKAAHDELEDSMTKLFMECDSPQIVLRNEERKKVILKNFDTKNQRLKKEDKSKPRCKNLTISRNLLKNEERKLENPESIQKILLKKEKNMYLLSKNGEGGRSSKSVESKTPEEETEIIPIDSKAYKLPILKNEEIKHKKRRKSCLKNEDAEKLVITKSEETPLSEETKNESPTKKEKSRRRVSKHKHNFIDEENTQLVLSEEEIIEGCDVKKQDNIKTRLKNEEGKYTILKSDDMSIEISKSERKFTREDSKHNKMKNEEMKKLKSSTNRKEKPIKLKIVKEDFLLVNNAEGEEIKKTRKSRIGEKVETRIKEEIMEIREIEDNHSTNIIKYHSTRRTKLSDTEKEESANCKLMKEESEDNKYSACRFQTIEFHKHTGNVAEVNLINEENLPRHRTAKISLNEEEIQSSKPARRLSTRKSCEDPDERKKKSGVELISEKKENEIFEEQSHSKIILKKPECKNFEENHASCKSKIENLKIKLKKVDVESKLKNEEIGDNTVIKYCSTPKMKCTDALDDEEIVVSKLKKEVGRKIIKRVSVSDSDNYIVKEDTCHLKSKIIDTDANKEESEKCIKGEERLNKGKEQSYELNTEENEENCSLLSSSNTNSNLELKKVKVEMKKKKVTSKPIDTNLVEEERDVKLSSSNEENEKNEGKKEVEVFSSKHNFSIITRKKKEPPKIRTPSARNKKFFNIEENKEIKPATDHKLTTPPIEPKPKPLKVKTKAELKIVTKPRSPPMKSILKKAPVPEKKKRLSLEEYNNRKRSCSSESEKSTKCEESPRKQKKDATLEDGAVEEIVNYTFSSSGGCVKTIRGADPRLQNRKEEIPKTPVLQIFLDDEEEEILDFEEESSSFWPEINNSRSSSSKSPLVKETKNENEEEKLLKSEDLEDPEKLEERINIETPENLVKKGDQLECLELAKNEDEESCIRDFETCISQEPIVSNLIITSTDDEISESNDRNKASGIEEIARKIDDIFTLTFKNEEELVAKFLKGDQLRPDEVNKAKNALEKKRLSSIGRSAATNRKNIIDLNDFNLKPERPKPKEMIIDLDELLPGNNNLKKSRIASEENCRRMSTEDSLSLETEELFDEFPRKPIIHEERFRNNEKSEVAKGAHEEMFQNRTSFDLDELILNTKSSNKSKIRIEESCENLRNLIEIATTSKSKEENNETSKHFQYRTSFDLDNLILGAQSRKTKNESSRKFGDRKRRRRTLTGGEEEIEERSRIFENKLSFNVEELIPKMITQKKLKKAKSDDEERSKHFSFDTEDKTTDLRELLTKNKMMRNAKLKNIDREESEEDGEICEYDDGSPNLEYRVHDEECFEDIDSVNYKFGKFPLQYKNTSPLYAQRYEDQVNVEDRINRNYIGFSKKLKRNKILSEESYGNSKDGPSHEFKNFSPNMRNYRNRRKFKESFINTEHCASRKNSFVENEESLIDTEENTVKDIEDKSNCSASSFRNEEIEESRVNFEEGVSTVVGNNPATTGTGEERSSKVAVDTRSNLKARRCDSDLARREDFESLQSLPSTRMHLDEESVSYNLIPIKKSSKLLIRKMLMVFNEERRIKIKSSREKGRICKLGILPMERGNCFEALPKENRGNFFNSVEERKRHRHLRRNIHESIRKLSQNEERELSCLLLVRENKINCILSSIHGPLPNEDNRLSEERRIIGESSIRRRNIGEFSIAEQVKDGKVILQSSRKPLSLKLVSEEERRNNVEFSKTKNYSKSLNILEGEQERNYLCTPNFEFSWNEERRKGVEYLSYSDLEEGKNCFNAEPSSCDERRNYNNTIRSERSSNEERRKNLESSKTKNYSKSLNILEGEQERNYLCTPNFELSWNEERRKGVYYLSYGDLEERPNRFNAGSSSYDERGNHHHNIIRFERPSNEGRRNYSASEETEIACLLLAHRVQEWGDRTIYMNCLFLPYPNETYIEESRNLTSSFPKIFECKEEIRFLLNLESFNYLSSQTAERRNFACSPPFLSSILNPLRRNSESSLPFLSSILNPLRRNSESSPPFLSSFLNPLRRNLTSSLHFLSSNLNPLYRMKEGRFELEESFSGRLELIIRCEERRELEDNFDVNVERLEAEKSLNFAFEEIIERSCKNLPQSSEKKTVKERRKSNGASCSNVGDIKEETKADFVLKNDDFAKIAISIEERKKCEQENYKACKHKKQHLESSKEEGADFERAIEESEEINNEEMKDFGNIKIKCRNVSKNRQCGEETNDNFEDSKEKRLIAKISNEENVDFKETIDNNEEYPYYSHVFTSITKIRRIDEKVNEKFEENRHVNEEIIEDLKNSKKSRQKTKSTKTENFEEIEEKTIENHGKVDNCKQNHQRNENIRINNVDTIQNRRNTVCNIEENLQFSRYPFEESEQAIGVTQANCINNFGNEELERNSLRCYSFKMTKNEDRRFGKRSSSFGGTEEPLKKLCCCLWSPMFEKTCATLIENNEDVLKKSRPCNENEENSKRPKLVLEDSYSTRMKNEIILKKLSSCSDNEENYKESKLKFEEFYSKRIDKDEISSHSSRNGNEGKLKKPKLEIEERLRKPKLEIEERLKKPKLEIEVKLKKPKLKILETDFTFVRNEENEKKLHSCSSKKRQFEEFCSVRIEDLRTCSLRTENEENLEKSSLEIEVSYSTNIGNEEELKKSKLEIGRFRYTHDRNGEKIKKSSGSLSASFVIEEIKNEDVVKNLDCCLWPSNSSPSGNGKILKKFKRTCIRNEEILKKGNGEKLKKSSGSLSTSFDIDEMKNEDVVKNLDNYKWSSNSSRTGNGGLLKKCTQTCIGNEEILKKGNGEKLKKSSGSLSTSFDIEEMKNEDVVKNLDCYLWSSNSSHTGNGEILKKLSFSWLSELYIGENYSTRIENEEIIKDSYLQSGNMLKKFCSSQPLRLDESDYKYEECNKNEDLSNLIASNYKCEESKIKDIKYDYYPRENVLKKLSSKLVAGNNEYEESRGILNMCYPRYSTEGSGDVDTNFGEEKFSRSSKIEYKTCLVPRRKKAKNMISSERALDSLKTASMAKVEDRGTKARKSIDDISRKLMTMKKGGEGMYESVLDSEDLKLHLKKVVVGAKKTRRKRRTRVKNYSVFEATTDAGIPKLIIKRNVCEVGAFASCGNLQPVVRIERDPVLDEWAKRITE